LSSHSSNDIVIPLISYAGVSCIDVFGTELEDAIDVEESFRVFFEEDEIFHKERSKIRKYRK